MNAYEITEKMAEVLSSRINDAVVRPTPMAGLAPEAYDALEAEKIVLVWLDYVPSYADQKDRYETGALIRGSFIKKFYRFVISVGLRSMNETPDLESLVESVESSLVNLSVGSLMPLRPVSISKMTVDSNRVFWRQMFFDTCQKLVIAEHRE